MRWVVEVDPQGHADVLCGGRRLRADISLDQALRFIRGRRQTGDRVFREAPDGYRTEITNNL